MQSDKTKNDKMEKPANIMSQGRNTGYSLESPGAFKNNQCPENWTELGGHIVFSKFPGSFYLQSRLQATMLQKTSIYFSYLPISLR